MNSRDRVLNPGPVLLYTYSIVKKGTQWMMALLPGVLMAVVAGCSDKPKADWYDISKDGNLIKQERIDKYMNEGMTEQQAKDAWWIREFTYNTETGGRSQTTKIEGRELQDAVQNSQE